MIRSFLFLFKGTVRFVKIGFLIVIVYAVILALFGHFIGSDQKILSSHTDRNEKEIQKVLNDPELNKTKQGQAAVKLYQMTLCNFSGQACENEKSVEENFQNSFFGSISSIVASPYLYQPASGIQWTFASLGHAGFVPRTYAAEGIGFAALSPLSNLWKLFRDVSYVLLVLVIIGIGFMIMFRTKLDPQTVISVESSLPRIIVALIMITFSYAIAGFLIDLMYMVIGLAISILAPVHPDRTETQLLNQFFTANLGEIWNSITPPKQTAWYSYTNIPLYSTIFSPLFDVSRIGKAIVDLFPPFINNIVRLVAAIFLMTTFAAQANKGLKLDGWASIFNNITFLGAGLGEVPGAILGSILSFLTYFVMFPLLLFYGAGFILGIMILLTVILLMFRIFFMLFFGYLRLLLYIIFSPLLLMFEAIPGNNIFNWWIRNVLGELVMFPTVIVLLIVGRIMHNMVSVGNVWQPPFLLGLEGESFAILVGTGIIFLIPDLTKIMKKLIGAEGLPINFGINTFLGGAMAIGQGGLASAGQFGSLGLALPGLRNLAVKAVGSNSTIGGLLSGNVPEAKKGPTTETDKQEA